MGSRADDWQIDLSLIRYRIPHIARGTSFRAEADACNVLRAGILVCGTQVVTFYFPDTSAFSNHTMNIPRRRARVQLASNAMRQEFTLRSMSPINAVDGYSNHYDLIPTLPSPNYGFNFIDLSESGVPFLFQGPSSYNLRAQEQHSVSQQLSPDPVTNNRFPRNSLLDDETSANLSVLRAHTSALPPQVVTIDGQAATKPQTTLQFVPYDHNSALKTPKTSRSPGAKPNIRKSGLKALAKRSDVLIANAVRVSCSAH